VAQLRRAPEIITIAKNLGLQGDDPVAAIMQHCRTRVESWLRAFKGPINLQRLHQVVADRLSIHHVVVSTDQELDDLITEYTRRGELIFRTLRDEFATGTQAITFKLTHPGLGARRHLAVIDGRRERAARVFFGKRHEDSHLLSLSPAQLSFVFRRTHATRANAEEALMDKIAGELAFYPPLFQPDLHQLQRRYGRPCFQLVDDLRDSVCPEASYIATAIAAVEQNETPALLVTARGSAKRGDSGTPPASWALRATSVKASAPAGRVGLMVPWNYRISPDSLIYRIFHDRFAARHDHADERLGTWASSDGSRLADLPVHVEVKKNDDHVLAMITLE